MSMRRREFMAALGGAAALPMVARAQQRMRRVGALFPLAESDPEQAARRDTLQQSLEQLGWTSGRNVQLDFRFNGNPDRFVPLAKELIAAKPDVIFAQTAGAVA